MNIFGITDPGSSADWFTGIVALAALIVAIFAGRAALQTNRAQQQTLALQQKQYEQSQAEKVSFWCSPVDSAPAGTDPWPSNIFIVNASESPIYRVLFVDNVRKLPFYVDNPSAYKIIERSDVILPTGGVPVELRLPAVALGMYFTDAMGRQWFRFFNGNLRRVIGSESDILKKLMLQ